MIGNGINVRGRAMGWRVVTAMLLFAMAPLAEAQDTREVTEPNIPASCVQLPAQLRAISDKLSDADEGKLDTTRIQDALDKCKPGMAVELKPSSGNNAFLTGPLEMRAGVTLLIDEGVTLFGSRDPAVYELTTPGATAGLCGTIATGAPPATFPAPQRPAPVRGGCRPLISIIDGRMLELWATASSTGAVMRSSRVRTIAGGRWRVRRSPGTSGTSRHE